MPRTVDKIAVAVTWHSYDAWHGKELPPMIDTYEIKAGDPLYDAILKRCAEIDAEKLASGPPSLGPIG